MVLTQDTMCNVSVMGRGQGNVLSVIWDANNNFTTNTGSIVLTNGYKLDKTTMRL